MSNKFAKLQKFISKNYDDVMTDLIDSYRQLLISIAKNNQVVVNPNITLRQAWELVSPYTDDLNLQFSVTALIRKSTMGEVFFAWSWLDTSVKLYGGDLFSQIDNPIQNTKQKQVKDKNAKDLQDFFEKVFFCLHDESRDFENPSFQTLVRTEKTLALARIEKTLAKQEHHPWDTFLLKLAEASLKKDTLEIFGAVLILLEYAEKPEAKSILSKDNANFKKGVVSHLKAVESSINDFLWRKADGDKLIYKHLIDLFIYLSKTQ